MTVQLSHTAISYLAVPEQWHSHMQGAGHELPPTLDMIFPPTDSDIAHRIERALDKDNTFVIFSGQTGTGRSTLLRATQNYMNPTSLEIADNRDKVVEALDEHRHDLYILEDVIASRDLAAVQDKLRFGFGDLYSDSESYRGSKIVCSMHSKNAAQVVERLTDETSIGSSDLLSLTSLIVHLSAVPKLCPKCSLTGFPHGCHVCRDGYCGKVILAETIEIIPAKVTPKIYKALAKTHRRQALEKLITEIGDYRRAVEHATALISNKITTRTAIKNTLGLEILPEMTKQGSKIAGGALNASPLNSLRAQFPRGTPRLSSTASTRPGTRDWVPPQRISSTAVFEKQLP